MNKAYVLLIVNCTKKRVTCGRLTCYMNIFNFISETRHPKKKIKKKIKLYKSSPYWPIMILVVTLWCLSL